MTQNGKDGESSMGGRSDARPEAPRTTQATGLIQRIKSLLGIGNNAGTLRDALQDALQDVIDEHDEVSSSDQLTEQEQAMLLNILSFGGLRVEDVMVPRADIVAVEAEESLEEILGTLADAGHSRVPVYRETLDDPVGMYHIKDLLPIALKQMKGAEVVGTWRARERRQVLFVPPSMGVLDLFLKMQATRVHMALVIDEYGGTDGLVTIEDLVEEIVGEIEDEHDVEEGPLLSETGPDRWLADARAPLEEVIGIFGQTMLLDDSDEDIDTLGGLIFDMIGRVPQRGELIKHPAGLEFEIADADARRIKKIRIRTVKEDRAPAARGGTRSEPSGEEGAVVSPVRPANRA